MGQGPVRLLEAGLEAYLADAGHRTRVFTVGLEPEPLRNEIQTMLALAERIRERCSQAAADGRVPVVMAGSCYAALGAVAALESVGTEPPGVAWFDSHADFNTPDTTLSGFLDGMSLATLAGRCWGQLTSGLGGFTPVEESAILLLGFRDVDPLERVLLEASDITALSPQEVRVGLDGPASALADRAKQLYLHLDLDVLDPSEGRVNPYQAPDGLTVADTRSAIRALAEAVPIRAVAITAYEPSVDTDGRAACAAFGLLGTAIESMQENR